MQSRIGRPTDTVPPPNNPFNTRLRPISSTSLFMRVLLDHSLYSSWIRSRPCPSLFSLQRGDTRLGHRVKKIADSNFPHEPQEIVIAGREFCLDVFPLCRGCRR